MPEGPATTVKGTVLSARLIRTRRRGFTIFEAILDDGSGPLRLVFFNQPYLQRWMTPKKTFWVYGVATQRARYRRGLVMENPQIEELIEDFLEGEEGTGAPAREGRAKARGAPRTLFPSAASFRSTASCPDSLRGCGGEPSFTF